MKEVTLSSNKNSAGWLANLSLEWRWAPGSQNECFWLWGHPILDTPASSWLLFLFPPWRDVTVLCFPTTFWQEAVLRKPDPMAVSRNVSSPLTHPQKLTHSSVLFCLPFCYILEYSWLRASHVSQWVKKQSSMQKTLVWPLGQVGPLEEGMAIHSSILAWRIPWTEEPGRLQSMGSQRVGHDWSNWECTQVVD